MKFVCGIFVALAFATPVMAHHTHSHRSEVQNIEHHHYYARPPIYRQPPRVIYRNNDWVGPAIITGIGTAIIVDQMNRRNERAPIIVEEVVVPAPKVTCHEWREIIEEDGRTYRERICRSN